MRRDQHDSAEAMILMGAGIDRGDGRAIAVTDQYTAPEIDCIEQRRHDGPRFIVHVGQWSGKIDRRRSAVARARINEDAAAGRPLQPVREVAPQVDAAETLVQQHQRRRDIRPRPDHPVFKTLGADGEEAGICKRHDKRYCSALSLKRWILPVAVFGKSFLNSIQRGYLYGASLAFT